MLICSFIYEGVQKPKGRKRRNGGKIYWKTEEVLSRFVWQGTTPEDWQVYSKIENHLQGRKGFSLQDIKTDYFNAHWLETIITNLDLNAESIKMHPNYPKLLRLGKLAA